MWISAMVPDGNRVGALCQLVRGYRSRVSGWSRFGAIGQARAYTPTAVQPLGTSHVTTDPAPILAKSPMLMSPRMVAPVLSRTPLPILGARFGVSTFRPIEIGVIEDRGRQGPAEYRVVGQGRFGLAPDRAPQRSA
jgi:hypothetical protein